jgi:seryl-tRNA synthetase
MSGIKDIIKNYIQIDDEIKSVNKQLKPLKATKNELGAQIQEYLTTNSDNPNSVLEVGRDIFKVVSTTKKRIIRDNFEAIIKENTSEDVAKIIIEGTTEEKESVCLKRTTKK